MDADYDVWSFIRFMDEAEEFDVAWGKEVEGAVDV